MTAKQGPTGSRDKTSMSKLNRSESCLIVGAGAAGLAAANVLIGEGVNVTVLDKARGVGGRLATRRITTDHENAGQATFDHGAQFFTARSDAFKDAVAQWQEAGVVREWFCGQPGNVSSPDEHPRYYGVSGMTAIAKYMARDVMVELNQTVVRLEHREDSWFGVTTGGTEFSGRSLILTPPVPQSLEFLRAGGIELTEKDSTALGEIRYEPCICVMAQLNGPSAILAPGAMRLDGGPVAWLADNYLKGVSQVTGAVTIHATPEWSREHYNDGDEALTKQLCESVRELLGAEVVATQIRRWRYSKAVGLYPAACLLAESVPPLVFAGDAFASTGIANVESAMLSGIAAAQSVLEASFAL